MSSMYHGNKDMGKNTVLLTVSGTIPANIEEQIANGERPMADYISLAKAFKADVIDYGKARSIAGFFGRILEFIWGPQLVLAWACFLLRKKYQVIFTDGEQIGIPFSMFLKFFSFSSRPKHLMIVHILSVRKKVLFFNIFRIQSHIDRFFVYSSFQKKFIQGLSGVPADRVTFTPFMVDHNFFAAESARPGDPLHLLSDNKPLICSVGLEFRDYPTLIDAVKGLDVKVIIAAGSPWSKRKDSTKGQEVPDTVTIKRFTQYDLRDVYAASRIVVMPLYPVEFQAGVTTILEAMSMERPVICSRISGQTDVVVDGVNGIYVPAKDPAAMRKAILYLLDHPEEGKCLGLAGRQTVVQGMSLELYTQRLKEYVDLAVSSGKS